MRVAICSICVITAMGIFLTQGVDASGIHSMKSRIQLSGEMDDNVGEDSRNVISSQALRFLTTTQGKGQVSNSFPYRYDALLGYRAYPAYNNENRLVAKLGSGLNYLMSQSVLWGVDGTLFLENYQANGRNNLAALAGIFCQIPQYVLKWIEVRLHFQAARTEYPNDSFFNYSDQWWSMDFRKTISRKLSFWTGYSYHPRQFARKALLSVPSTIYNEHANVILPAGYQHRDIINEYTIGGQWYRGFLINAYVVFRKTHSNSFGFSQWENRFCLIAGVPFFFKSLAKIYLTVEAKKYDEKLTLPIVTDIDEDKEEDNRLIVELSRDVLPSLAIEIRYEWLRNESRIRNLYYSKHILSSGLEYSF